MRVMLLLMMAVLLALPVAAAWAEDTAGVGFFRSVEDLPLMPGLTERVEDTVVFDQPGGRVIEAAAHAPVGIPAARIEAFYAETLPQLGWTPAGPGLFVREAESLRVDVTSRRDGTTDIRLSIQPRGQSVKTP